MIFIFLGGWLGIFTVLFAGMMFLGWGDSIDLLPILLFAAVLSAVLTSHRSLSEKLQRMEEKLDALTPPAKDDSHPPKNEAGKPS